jgi:hypothetical protein
MEQHLLANVSEELAVELDTKSAAFSQAKSESCFSDIPEHMFDS